jgi:ergothioneine biosynthesis protein EgtB
MLTHGDVALEHPLLSRISDARLRSDALFDIVQPAALYDRPIAERHRILFYVGHLEAFDWNLLHEPLGLKHFHPDFDRLFAFGIDPVGGGLPTDQPSDWPALATVHDYVAKIRAALDEALSLAIFRSDEVMRDGFPLDTLLNVAIEHRLMHVETLAYMLHQLPLERKIPSTQDLVLLTPPVTPQMVSVPRGTAQLGLSRSSPEFGWDNEYGSFAIDVPAFEIDRYMITNGQFLEFIQAGGYESREFWNDDAWGWKEKHGISHPAFWKHAHPRWLYRTMFDEVPLPLDWPVYVSHAEATAYARWVGKSLPTEEQWRRAAYGTRTGAQRRYPWGDRQPNDTLGNFDLQRWDPAPVNAYPAGASDFGAEGMLGNGWEWTASQFAPFPGFEPFPFYRGYSADFFDHKHFVMKGGSARTAACMLRPTFRNWFQAHYQYAYAGFRCVKS